MPPQTRTVPSQLLLVEDDLRLARQVGDFLQTAGWQVTHAANAAQAESQLKPRRGDAPDFDALVLDLMLPDGDGLDICRRLRTHSDLPVLMLTARGDPFDRVVGLEIGADDYLTKPFEPRELLARLRAITRRRAGSLAPRDPQAEQILRFGRLEIDPAARQARVDGEERPMTAYQFDLLQVLARHPGRVLTREFLLGAVKGESLEAFDRSIDVHISRIRAAIEDDPRHPRRILTLRGAGYVFTKSQDGL
ncbi:MAG: response regulator transcription factor [Thiomonas sp.]|uniref:response regulator transcription factor n=1 Tax=Thiomonas sp. TaxID=2047785 RepID=UPI002A370EAD|nr:response regulator transcription factor [Thiomonas sp.]MDY0330144.1 response regulator transcription factor [Thiomonas sp.]